MSGIKFIKLFAPCAPEVRDSKGGKPYTSINLQGVAVLENGREEVFSDKLFPTRDKDGKPEPMPTYPPGVYLPKHTLEIDRATRRFVGRLVGLSPAQAKPQSVPSTGTNG